MALFDANLNSVPRWADYENPLAEKGKGGTANGGAKGRAFDKLPAGDTAVMIDARGSGVIRRIWITISDRSEAMLRALRLRMYWDGSDSPAVDCPLGIFFGFGLSKMTPFESELFSSPEGRSFNCFIPMPFYSSARITLTNESETSLSHLFYDVDFTLEPIEPGKALSFHAIYRRPRDARVGVDHEILPKVSGHGRFLGMTVGVHCHESYRDTWFGEGEVKMYLDGDGEYPTMCGTGVEDYIGTAWGQGEFVNRTQGCLEADGENGRFALYRFHTVDPIYFQSDLRVTMQRIGGGHGKTVLEIEKSGANMKIVSGDSPETGFYPMYDPPRDAPKNSTWFNFYRADDYESCAYFYLDSPIPRI